MKKLLLLTCMLLCTCLIGWAQDEEPEGAELSITCNSEELTDFEAEGGSQQVKITSNADWKVSDVPDWITVDPNSGEAGIDIEVAITVNSNVNTEASTEAREATITFTATKGEETKTVTLTIKQKGKEVEPEPLSITCSVEELPEFEAPGGTRQVMITTNASWTVSGVTEWLYINPEKGEAGTNISVSIQVYPNTTTEEREATLTFKATKDGKSETVTLTIKQKGKEVEPEPEPEPVSITCNSEGLPEFEAEGGKQDIKITSNADWTVSGVPDWITVTPDNGNAGTDLSVAITVNSNIDANASTKERNATITFTATKGEETKTVTLTIKQKGKEVEPEPEPVSITCSVEELPEFNAEGGKQEVKITSNGIWNASEFPKWITVTPQTGGEGTDISVEIEVSENTSTEPREATIIFTATKGEETKTITLTIKQKGKEVEPEPVSITCSVEELPEFDAEGGKQEIKITSNGIWNASEFPNWVKVTPQTDGEGTDISVEIEVGENTSTEPRNATISFTATKGEETKTVTLTIKQKGKEVEPEPEPVSITCNSEGLQAFEADGGQQQVKITSNADWTVSGLLEWITVTPSEGKEGTDVLVTIQVNPNTTTDAREATITFTATKGEETKTETLTIKQKGKEVEPEPVSITCDAEELPEFESDGGTLPVNITSNADWTVSELPEWITVTPSSGNAGTDIPVEIKVGENTTTNAREATITFTATKGEETKTISLTIKQKGKEVEPEPEPLSITCSVEELPEFEADGGQQQVKITSNADWAVSGLPEWITVTPSEGNAGTDMLVTIQTNPNTEANPREATITFAASKDGQIESVTLTIKQKTKEVVPESVSITCNSEGLQAFEADGGQQQVKITSNASWSVSGMPEWISMVDPSNGEAGKDILVTIQVSPNIGAEPREVTITFTATKGEETKTTKLTIKQKGKEITPAEISYQLKSLDGASIENQTKLDTLSAGSHVLELEIESDDSWHANTTSEWIKVSPNKGQDGKTTVTISIAPNTTKEKRSGTVKFIADSDTEEDYVSQLTIWQAFADTITTYKIKYTSNWDKTQNNVLEGEKIEVSFVLTENGTPISDYSNFTWETPSDDSKQFTITAEYKENGGPQYYQPKLKMNGIPVKVDPFSYTVWPKIQVPADWQMALTDVNRSKAIGKGIRAGNEFKLEKNPIMQGGYQAANNWTYEIKVNNELITPNANKLIIPTKQDSYSAEIVCYAVNLYDGKTEMGRIEIGRVSTTIYPKPVTPSSLVLKGNGTSGTWFVNDTKDIYMGYGDGDYHDIAIDTRSDKWFVSTASTSHLNDNPYIYKTKTYSDNVTITSGRRYKDRTDEAWDGSTYEGETRGYSDSTDITGPFATTGASASYNINGVKTATMTRGLNIIRMEDGTVKKVFKK